MLKALHYSKELLRTLVSQFPNGTFIDATLGKGNDLISVLTHPHFTGKVIGFDIQEAAIQTTQERIYTHGIEGEYQLIQNSHAKLADYLESDEQIHGAIFNLGYLPGGDHSITTQANSTLLAIEEMGSRLVTKGQIIIVVYSGHPAGQAEKESLFQALSTWPQENFQVLQYEFINQRNNPPMVIIIEKR
ncbi:tRNA (mnm(5)s(2)U34)-methyltransferase [Fundicoccus sp. Sow4_D5]|uniref:tRNA (mnm(5)s(2)U34)-methyltransferase n=1 Tax=unclassified Fundicoccus TaxID=2761543 RepID=UPI003F8DACD0